MGKMAKVRVKIKLASGESLQHIIHIPFIGYLSFFFQHTHVFGVSQKLRRENKIIEPLVFAEDDLLIISFPFFFALVHVNDIISYFHHTVHVVGVNHSGDVVFNRYFLYQFVNDQ
jgi:hypothetical protein